MQARQLLTLGQKGAKKFIEHYGGQLVCARYCYDEQRRKRGATVEIIVEESGWSSLEKLEIVGLRVEFQETDLQRRVKLTGGKWNSAKRVSVVPKFRRHSVINAVAGGPGPVTLVVQTNHQHIAVLRKWLRD